MTDRLNRIHERLHIAARLYQLARREGRKACRLATSLCHAARAMAAEEKRRELSTWAMKCAEVAEGLHDA